MFIVGLMMSLFSVYRIGDLMDAKSEVTMVKTNAQGEREIIVKKGTKITAYKVSGKTVAGDGERLGTAYRLANGQIIYVPEARGCADSLASPCFALAMTVSGRRTRPFTSRSFVAAAADSRFVSPTSFPTAICPALSRLQGAAAGAA